MSVFTGILDRWVTEVPERINAVRKSALQRVLSLAQTPVGAGGNMPIKDGFLRASLVVQIGEGSFIGTDKPQEGVPYSWDAGQMTLTLASAEPSDTITAAWTASYARLAHYGGPNRLARRFRDLPVQQWPQILTEEAAKAKARGSRGKR